jgi:hypothetical protein
LTGTCTITVAGGAARIGGKFQVSTRPYPFSIATRPQPFSIVSQY